MSVSRVPGPPDHVLGNSVLMSARGRVGGCVRVVLSESDCLSGLHCCFCTCNIHPPCPLCVPPSPFLKRAGPCAILGEGRRGKMGL